MKKIVIIEFIFCMLFFYQAQNVIGQNIIVDSVKSKKISPIIFSADLNVTYPFYFIENSRCNYGFGGSVSAHFKRIKLTLGLNYTTKKHIEMWNNNSYYFDKIYYNISYYNIPISINVSLFNGLFNKKNDLIIGTGLIINIPGKYEAIIPYNHPLPTPSPYKPDYLGVGKSFQFAIRYQRQINKIVDFYFSGLFCYKFRLEYYRNASLMTPWAPVFSEDKLSFGLSTGFEIFFNKRRNK